MTELWLLICRVPPKVPAAAKPVEGEARRRLKGRLGVEHGLPPGKIAQFDRYDELRARAAAHFAYGGYEAGRPLSLASMFLRGDIAALEDVATLTPRPRARAGQGGRDGRDRRRAPPLGPRRLPLRRARRGEALLLPAGLRADRVRMGLREGPAGEKRDYR